MESVVVTVKGNKGNLSRQYRLTLGTDTAEQLKVYKREVSDLYKSIYNHAVVTSVDVSVREAR